MLTALSGVIGVVCGAVVASLLATTRDRRTARTDTLIEVVTAAANVIAAHERLHELSFVEGTLDPHEERGRLALQARTDAHASWRVATARTRILMPTATRLIVAMDSFDHARASATPWVHAKMGFAGAAGNSADLAEEQHAAWIAMRAGRHSLIDAAQEIAARDSRAWPLMWR